MKILAKTLKEWWSLPDWPEDQYIDDDGYKVNGVDVEEFNVEKLDDADEVEILCGSIINGDKGKDMKTEIRKWLKTRTHVTFLVEVPREREAEVRAFIKSFTK